MAIGHLMKKAMKLAKWVQENTFFIFGA